MHSHAYVVHMYMQTHMHNVNIQKYKRTQRDRHQQQQRIELYVIKSLALQCSNSDDSSSSSANSSGHRHRQRSCWAAHASLLIYKLSQPLCVQLSVMCPDIQTNIRTYVRIRLPLRMSYVRTCVHEVCLCSCCSCMRVRSCVWCHRRYWKYVCIYVWTFLHNITTYRRWIVENCLGLRTTGRRSDTKWFFFQLNSLYICLYECINTCTHIKYVCMYVCTYHFHFHGTNMAAQKKVALKTLTLLCLLTHNLKHFFTFTHQFFFVIYTHVCKYTYISGFLIKYWKNERPLKADWLIGERRFRLRCRLLVAL